MKSIFERPIFDSNHQVACWKVRDEIKNARFVMSEWSIFHMSKNSLTIRHNVTGEMFFIGRQTFNKVIYDPRTPVKYTRQPHPKDNTKILNWIKLDN